MATPKQPQDHQAKAEAKGQNVEFDHEGVHYVIDRDNINDLELQEFIDDEKWIPAIRGYIGRDQWVKFKDANRDDKGRVDPDAFEPFMTAVMAAIGGGPVESPSSLASPTS